MPSSSRRPLHRAIPWLAAAALSLAGAACDDGETGGEPDATLDTAADLDDDTAADTTPGDTSADTAADTDDDGTDDGADTTPPPCDPAVCAQSGRVCDPEGADCIEPIPACSTDGDACTPGEGVAQGFVCAARPGGDGVCRVACADDAPCPEGLACLDGPEGRWCQPDECTGYFDDDCAEGRCVPVAPAIDMCVPDGGTRIEHAPCTWHTDCAADGICVGGRCALPACTPGSIAPVPCTEATDLCDALRLDDTPLGVGVCRARCSPWGDPAECLANEWCRPVGDDDGVLVGVCTPDVGVGLVDSACSGALACDRGLVCSRGVCKEACDPAAAGGGAACADDTRACVPFFAGTPFASAWGLCLDPCTPFAASNGCAAGEWCAVNIYLDEAFCQATGGSVGEAGSCFGVTPADTCADGLICLETLDCRTVCDPDAQPGGRGDTCPDATACAVLSDAQGNALSVGYCAPSCDYHGGTVACADPVRTTCAMGEGFFQDFDLCLPPPRAVLDPDASCAAAGLYEFELCAEGGAVCLPRPGDAALVCKDMCAVSEGPFGMVGHPDCRNPAQSCSPVFGTGAALGLCL